MQDHATMQNLLKETTAKTIDMTGAPKQLTPDQRREIIYTVLELLECNNRDIESVNLLGPDGNPANAIKVKLTSPEAKAAVIKNYYAQPLAYIETPLQQSSSNIQNIFRCIGKPSVHDRMSPNDKHKQISGGIKNILLNIYHCVGTSKWILLLLRGKSY